MELYKSMEKLHKIVCNKLNVDYEKSFKTRKMEYVQARQWTMCITYLIVKNVSLREIGLFFNKDHATVLYAKKNIKNFCDIDEKYRYMYENIYKMAKNIFKEKENNFIVYDNKQTINDIRKLIYSNCNINISIEANNMLSRLN